MAQLGQSAVVELVKDQLMPAFVKERERLNRIDKWLRWECEDVMIRRQGATREIRQLVKLAKTPLLGLVVATLAQQLLVSSYRTTDPDQDDAPAWAYWLANKLPGRQYAIHHAAIAYGHAYTTVLPGVDPITGLDVPVIRGKSPRKFLAFYQDPEADDWPMFTLEVIAQPGNKYALAVMDEEHVYRLTTDRNEAATPEYITTDDHGVGVAPAVRYSSFVDLEGRTDGRVEPFISVAGRAQKTMFDRMLIQHFNSWKIRTIAGMTLPDDESEANRKKVKLSQEDFLIAGDAATKFGQLDETSLEGVNTAFKSDVETLATVSQTPTHTLTGDLVNLSADAIKESRISLENLASITKGSLGESHKQTLKLAASIAGDAAAAADDTATIGWEDTDSRSLAQAADGLGKLALLLHVPPTELWQDIPGWTQERVERAKRLVEEGGDPIDRLLAELTKQTGPGGTGQQTADSGANSGG